MKLYPTILLLVLVSLYYCYENCISYQSQSLEWSIIGTTLQMRLNCSKGGSVGWCAIGFNNLGVAMPGASVIMGYSNKINEYRSLGNYMPIKAVSRLRNAKTAAVGTKRILEFTRPLSVTADSSYYPITNKDMNVMVAYNEATTPRSDTSWTQHTQTVIMPFNLFDPYPCSWTCGGKDSKDPTVCSSQGTCTSQNRCTCKSGHSGANCETFSCYGVDSKSATTCSGNGICASPNTCRCQTGYSGAKCELISCFGKLSNNPLVCSGNGTCVSPNKCVCVTGRIGSECQSLPPPCTTCQISCFGIPQNDSFVCSGHGICLYNNNCTCINGYFGNDCSNYTCFGKSQIQEPCSRNGLCVGPDICNCVQGYIGKNCDKYTCFDIAQDDQNVCNGNGSCVSVDRCSCKDGLQGDQCHIKVVDDPIIPDPTPPPSIFPKLENCVNLGGNHAFWTVQNGSLFMKVVFEKGLRGWAAVGFNRDGMTMENGNFVMIYDGNVNEYSATGYSLPYLISTRITNTKVSALGIESPVLEFERPISDPIDNNYLQLTDPYHTIMIALNSDEKPKSPNNFPMHSEKYYKSVSLTGKNSCVSDSIAISLAIHIVICLILFHLE